jgi:transmembrane sensor
MMNHKRDHIDENLLLQYLLGKASAEEHKVIEDWLNESKQNRENLDRLESLWLETGKIDPAPVAVDAEAAWQRISGRIHHLDEEKSVQQQGKIIQAKWLKVTLSVAAVALVLIGIYSLIRIIVKPVGEKMLVSTDTVLADTLPDGSMITLNKGSKLLYPERFTGITREVKLTGEAFFDIRHDSMQPFVVDLGIAKIKVLGTSFRVSAYPDSAVEVSVINGKVMFFTINPATRDSSRVILVAGTKGMLPVKSILPVLVENTPPDDLFWFDRSLEFTRTPLSRVFGLLERYYPITIRVSNENINNCLLTASFTDDSIDRILTVIAESFDLQVISKNQTFFLTGNGCPNANK